MNDYVTSMIRTYVPIVAGWVVAWLASYQVDIDSTSLAIVLTGLFSGIWYAAARALEARWPAAGFLLGKRSTPTY